MGLTPDREESSLWGMDSQIVGILYEHTPIHGGPRPRVQVVCRNPDCAFIGNADEHRWHVASLIAEL